MLKFISRPRPGPFCEFTTLLRLLVASSVLTMSWPSHADIPVYLKPESRFPSGVHPRAWLEEKTTENDVQRWFRVMTSNAEQKSYGWLPEDHVLTLLKLTSIARTIRPEPDRSAPQIDAVRTARIEKGSQAIVLEVRGAWSRVRILADKSANQDSWILNEALERDPGNQIQRAVTFRDSPLRLEPRLEKKPHDRLPAFKEVAVLNMKATGSDAWIEIQQEDGSAWIERKNLWLPQDLKDGSIRALQAGLELRSAPLPYADVVKHLEGFEILKVIETKSVRWGKVKIPEHGWLWWPISEDSAGGGDTIPPLKMTTQDLVVRRIYDMALSPSVPGLRFASAQGLFKSRDGIEWSLIPKFTDENFPLAIAKNGLVFVGPYLSSDDGEKFEQWIRWDRLIETVKKGTGSPPAKLRLSQLQTLDDEGKNIQLILDVGRTKPIRIGTTDRGLNWKIL